MSFLRSLTSQKSTDIASSDKKFYQITAIVGGAFALLAMLFTVIMTAGFKASYIWSALALGLGSAVFYGLVYVRYMMPKNRLIARVADAAVYFTLFAAYTPLQILLIKDALYDNGFITMGWVMFGLVAGFSFLFLVASLCSVNKFRMLGSFFYILMALSIVIGAHPLMNAINFAPVLGVILAALAALAFAATPVIFWFFDRFAWQMKVFYILMATGTVLSSVLTLLYVLFCI